MEIQYFERGLNYAKREFMLYRKTSEFKAS